jgi:hypothetical protein
MESLTMTKVLIDVAMVAIAFMAGGSIMNSGRRFMTLFAQLRADMAAGLPMQTMQVTVRATGVATTLGPVPAMAYQPGISVADNAAGALALSPRPYPRPAAMRAAA